MPERTRDRTAAQDSKETEGEGQRQDQTQDRASSKREELAPDEQHAAAREAMRDEAKAQDQIALAERWPELTEGAEAELKDAYRAVAEAAESAAQALDDVARELDARALGNADPSGARREQDVDVERALREAIEDLRVEVDHHVDEARQQVADARTAAEGHGTVDVDAANGLSARQEAMDDVIRRAKELLDVTPADDASLRATVERDRSSVESRTQSNDLLRAAAETPEAARETWNADWTEARGRDEAELASRWEELDATSEEVLKDAYRGVAEQAEVTRQEIDAIAQDIDESFGHAAQMLEARHAQEAREAKRAGMPAEAELAQRQAGERTWLENEQATAERSVVELRDELAVRLEEARGDVATQRASPDEVSAKPFEQRRAELENLQQDGRDVRADMAVTTRALANVAKEAATKITRDKTAAVAFARDAEATIAKDSNHPLRFLLDEKTKEFNSRQRGDDNRPAVEIGHEISHSARSVERFMLEDAEFNALSNRAVESRKGAIMKTAVDIGGVAVERRTAMTWERLGELQLPGGKRVRDLPLAQGRRRSRDRKA